MTVKGNLRVLALLLSVVISGAAGQSSNDPVQRAREHAEHHQGKGEAKAESELVRALVERSGTLYAAGKYDDAARDLEDARVALGRLQQSVEEYKHDAKQCDLILAHVERLLKDESRNSALQDRPRVDALIKQLDVVRDRLLQLVFETR